MLLISLLFTDLTHRFRAPPGKQYFVESINFMAGTGVASSILIFDRWVGFEVVDLSSARHVLATFNTEISGTNHNITSINHKTKYLSISKDISGNVAVPIEIYGEIIPISKLEAIWEWFGKGR